MKIMVLNDGETFTSIQGCQIVKFKDNTTTEEIEKCLKILNRDNYDCDTGKIIGGFDNNGSYIVGDPREMMETRNRKIIKLE